MTPLEALSSPWFFGWLFGLFALWVPLLFLCKRAFYFKTKPVSASHQFVVIVPFLFLASFGSYTWFFDKEFVAAFEDDKYFGEYQAGIILVQVMLAFQIWDFCATLAMASAREVKGQTQHLVHHMSSGTLCLAALLTGEHGFLIYYSGFFFGVTEISSIPLAVMDLFKYSKELSAVLPKTTEAVRAIFAVMFLVIRCVYWPIVQVDFWVTSLRHVSSGETHYGYFVLWWIASIGLTLLQFYWGSLIIKGLIKMLKGKDPEQVRDYDPKVELERGRQQPLNA